LTCCRLLRVPPTALVSARVNATGASLNTNVTSVSTVNGAVLPSVPGVQSELRYDDSQFIKTTTGTLVTYWEISRSTTQRRHRRRCPARRRPFRFRGHLHLTERHFLFCRWANCWPTLAKRTDTYTISALIDSASPITGIFLDAIGQAGRSPSRTVCLPLPARRLQARGRGGGRPQEYRRNDLHVEIPALVRDGLPAKKDALVEQLCIAQARCSVVKDFADGGCCVVVHV
jgi:hypothetical protein